MYLILVQSLVSKVDTALQFLFLSLDLSVLGLPSCNIL